MRTEGTLKSWNDDRGFGFVTTAQTRQDIFVHISALPQSGRRPQPGERLSFEIETGPDGRKRAVSVVYLAPSATPANAAATRPPRPARTQRPDADHVRDTRPRHGRGTPRRQRTPRSGGLFGWPMALLTVFAGGAWLYQSFDTRVPAAPAPSAPALSAQAAQAAQATPAPRYACNGRQHCSQMSSCEEARYVLRHCPDTKMDGDNDGIPCEDSLCGH